MRISNIILVLLFTVFSISLIGQDYSVIHIEGDAFAYTTKDDKEKYTKLMYGPLLDCEKIVVKNNSIVKVLGKGNKICVLDKEGNYKIAELTFSETQENSIFNRFCNYFHAFFNDHSSSESKANYQNNIYAISRGSMAAPSLDFPLEGFVPADEGSIPFIWTHDCDSCEYIFNINDYESRELIYTTMTEDKTVMVENPMKYFTAEKEYYWSVKIVGSDLEYETIPFTISALGNYKNTLKEINTEISKSNTSLTEAAKMIFVLGELGYDNTNYAIFYGLNQRNKHADDVLLQNIFERFWYDTLMEK